MLEQDACFDPTSVKMLGMVASMVEVVGPFVVACKCTTVARIHTQDDKYKAPHQPA